jgi:hypothetical protein
MCRRNLINHVAVTLHRDDAGSGFGFISNHGQRIRKTPRIDVLYPDNAGLRFDHPHSAASSGQSLTATSHTGNPRRGLSG